MALCLFDSGTDVTSAPCAVATRLRSVGLRRLEAASSVTADRLGEIIWLSRSSSELDDGGDGDKDVPQLVEDGVGESLPYEVDARGECGASLKDESR
jgi:hypothetical protein